MSFRRIWKLAALLGVISYSARAGAGESKASASGGATMLPAVERIEVVTDQALVGDGGNNWGGHQTRIVRTEQGVFVAYTTGESDPPGAPWRAYDGKPRSWNVALRTEDGWRFLAQGPSGREPVNLMAGPKGQLHIVAWPDGTPHLWTGMPDKGAVKFADAAIPGPWEKSHWPYNSAGISPEGDVALVQSAGEVPGRFVWGYLSAQDKKWVSGTWQPKQRHCYTYVLPGPGGRLEFTSTRDVLAKSMGYEGSATNHSLGYVFNSVSAWRTEHAGAKPLSELQIAESVPTKEFPEVAACGTCVDTYLDTRGCLHVLYFFKGAETKGKQCIRHSILKDNKVVKTVELPEEFNVCFTAVSEGKDHPKYCRIIQDTAGRFYLIGTTAIVPADAEDGTVLGKPVPLDLKGHAVEYSGMALAAPRGGTPLADVVDAVFPAGGGKKVVYVRIKLR